MQNTIEAIILYYKSGSSDKVYQASIEPAGNDLYTVNFAYGRRGNTLQTGTKTQSPVPYDKAKAIYDRLVKSKTAKGYTPGEDGTPYVGTGDKKDTDIHCQLLNLIEESNLDPMRKGLTPMSGARGWPDPAFMSVDPNTMRLVVSKECINDCGLFADKKINKPWKVLFKDSFSIKPVVRLFNLLGRSKKTVRTGMQSLRQTIPSDLPCVCTRLWQTDAAAFR